MERYFAEHDALEIWERNWMHPEMQTTLFNTYFPKLFAVILKAFSGQLKENNQLNAVEEIAGPVPELPLECEQILKGGGGFWDDVNSGYLPEDPVLAARREEIEWVHSDGVYENVPKQECIDSGQKLLGLIWVHTTNLLTPLTRKFDRGCVQESTRRRSKAREDSKSIACFSIVFCSVPT